MNSLSTIWGWSLQALEVKRLFMYIYTSPHIQRQRRIPEDSRRGKITFRIKPLSHQRHLECSNKPCVHQDPETPQRLSQNCVWVSPVKVQVSSGLQQGNRHWVHQTWVCHNSSWRRSPLTPPESHQNWHRTGETDSCRAQTELCVLQDPGERISDHKSDWPRLAHECPGVSGRGVGRWGPAAGLRELSAAVHSWDLLKEVTIIFITSTIVRPQVNQQRGTKPTHQQKIGLKIYWAPPIRTRPSFPFSRSLPSGRFHKPLSFSIRGQAEWKPQSQKTNQTEHMEYNLF